MSSVEPWEPPEDPELVRTVEAEVEEDLPLGEHERMMMQHVSQRHVPYLAGCEACARSRGRIPARRIARGPDPFALGADFAHFGPWKLLTLVVFLTQMVCVVVLMGDNVDSNARAVNRA